MKVYTVRSGQNIFDVAVTLHGSVEGVFDLLISNEELELTTQLSGGMKLYYHEEFIINGGIADWIAKNKIIVRNGHRKLEYPVIRSIFLMWLYSYDEDKYNELMACTVEEQDEYLSRFDTPKMIVSQEGQVCQIGAWLKPDAYMVIDWGDCTAPQVFAETEDETEILHSYNGTGKHEIRIYGTLSFYSLDMTNVNGTYYLTESISADQFTDPNNAEELKTLIQ